MKLKRQQLEQLLENARLDFKGENLYAICPYCKHDEFGISLGENHLFNCFRKSACGAVGNIYTLLKYLGKLREFLSEREIDIFEKLESNLVNADIIELVHNLPEKSPPVMWKRVTDDPYLRERGFQDYQFEKFEVGRSKVKPDYVTFLVRMEGRLIGYVTRSTKKKEWIDAFNAEQERLGTGIQHLRYDNSTTDFSKTLFGLDEIIPNETSDVILVEGIFSKTKTDVNLCLDEDNSMKCCATLGAKLSPHQIDLLKKRGVKRLWFWFEADVLDKVKDIVARASLEFDVLVSYLNGKDPNDINEGEALFLLEKAKNWLDFNHSYIKSSLKK